MDGEHISLRSGDNAPNRRTGTDPSRGLAVADAERSLRRCREAFPVKSRVRVRGFAKGLSALIVAACGGRGFLVGQSPGRLISVLAADPRSKGWLVAENAGGATGPSSAYSSGSGF